MKTKRTGMDLVFKNICVTIGDKTILKDVSGLACPGEILAVMGPSGAGKTSLIDCLAGRRRFDSGNVMLNSFTLDKELRRNIAYVQQSDIFLSELTAWDTIWYNALLRLPDSMPLKEKKQCVDEVIDALDLRKCLETKIGSPMVRGLSGGEKRRANIACELLTNPAVIVLDEPTSGLDSSTSNSLMRSLKHHVKQSMKTMVVTIHQPSSLIFNTFDKLLLLCEGEVAYYGDVMSCADYFAGVDLPCPSNFNLAEHISALRLSELIHALSIRDIHAIVYHVFSVCSQCTSLLTDSWKDKRRCMDNRTDNHPLDCVKDTPETKAKLKQRAVQQRAEPKYPPELLTKDSTVGQLMRRMQNSISVSIKGDHKSHVNQSFTADQADTSDAEKGVSGARVHKFNNTEDLTKYKADYDKKWPTGFFTQFTVLCRRAFWQALPRVLNKWKIIQMIVTGVLVGLFWFQVEPKEEYLQDRIGFMYIAMTFASFLIIADGVVSVWSEKVVVNKERFGGHYRLSAYFLAKNAIEFSLVTLYPILFFIPAYWMSGLNSSFSVFVSLTLITFASLLVAQSFGYLCGSIFGDPTLGLTAGSTFFLLSLLSGGLYTRNLPSWLTWFKYLSYHQMSVYPMLLIDFNTVDIQCADYGSEFQTCYDTNITSTAGVRYIPRQDLIDTYTLSSSGWQLYHYCLWFVGVIVFFRTLTYLVLRFIHKPQA